MLIAYYPGPSIIWVYACSRTGVARRWKWGGFELYAAKEAFELYAATVQFYL